MILPEIRELVRFPGYGLSRDGSAWSKKRGAWRQLTPTKEYTGPGYLMVVLYINGRQRKLFLHSLMLETFVGPRPTPKHQARHLDGVFSNNNIGNLAWGTPRENHEDKRRHGTLLSGASHPMARLSQEDVDYVRALARLGIRGAHIADELGITRSAVSAITTGKAWRNE